jgi:predicted glycogen debranching enzyme
MLRFEDASRREWLETNGLGGYASSTLAGMNTRRYHGLLVAAGRVLLAKIEETLVVGSRRYELSTNRYPGAVHPQGYAWLQEFRLDPFPVLVFECEGTLLEKSVFMVHGEDTTVVQYQASEACEIELRPLVAFRDYHALTHENGALRADVEMAPGSVSVAPYEGLPALHLAHAGGRVDPLGCWYRNFEYDRERERGLDYLEDLFQPFTLTLNLAADARAAVVASTAPRAVDSAEGLRRAETARRKALGAGSLERAADQFLVEVLGWRAEACPTRRSTIIAGYHWFTDWGRDTMISLPGLTLSTGRPETARAILLSFASVADRGMLPNRFPEAGGAPEYNTVDATLWYFEAIRAYAARTGDFAFVRDHLYEVLAGMISWHECGTRYGIRVDAAGLLQAGEPGTQLTWMDAKVGDWVVTPRRGKPVEIQALWYNALRVMEDLAGRFGREAQRAHYASLAGRARAAFAEQFWNGAQGCLFDVVDGGQADASIRPNQIFAVSLSHRMLPRERASSVVETVRRHLLTPYGLRTLAPSDPQYRGRYEGSALSRDGAYHQGTVWPWLLGPFIEASLAVNEDSAEARRQAAEWLSPLLEYLDREGTGQLPEVFDGDPPHRAGGAIAQAWSVAELLRIREMIRYRE